MPAESNSCNTGKYVFFTHTQNVWWIWNCNGLNGGNSVLCYSLEKVDGICGTAATTYSSGAAAFSGAMCGVDKEVTTPASPVFPGAGSSTTWTCGGLHGGLSSGACIATRSAAPVNGACGSAHTQSYYAQPSGAALCSAGSSGTVFYGSNSWVWACNGLNGGTNIGCYSYQKVDGAAGTAKGKAYPSTITAYGSDTQCAAGTSSNTSFPAAGGSTSWVCNGLNGGTNSVSCSASRSAAPINGVCGTANTKVYASGVTAYGSDTQCAAGTSGNTAFPAAGGSTSWTCNGLNGGTNSVTCSASRSAAPVTTAVNLKNPLDIATAIGKSDESCWYCSHYRNTSNAIVSALGGSAGNIQFKFDYQSGGGNITGYQFAIGPVNDVNNAPIKSDDWVAVSGASGTTITVSSLKIGGFTNNISVQRSPYPALAQLSYNTNYYWWVKVKNAAQESAWIPGDTYMAVSHHYPIVKAVYANTGAGLQSCTTVATMNGGIFNLSANPFKLIDPCYAACGAANISSLSDLENPAKWKCSVCYDSATNVPNTCGTAANPIQWTLLTVPSGFTYKAGSTATTPNPIFTGLANQQNLTLQLDITGSSCPLEQGLIGTTTPLPRWVEN
jgi:hypothetical protein